MRLETRVVKFKSTTFVKSLDNFKFVRSEGGQDNEEDRTVTVWMAPIGGRSFLPILSEGEPIPSSTSSYLRDSPTSFSDRNYVRNPGVTSPASSNQRTSAGSSSGDGGVATFCDWSHGKCRSSDFNTRSTSLMSPRPLPVMSADQGMMRARLKQMRGESLPGSGTGHGSRHLHHRGFNTGGTSMSYPESSRMFIRQKSGATKGEKEIMMGICQNRGDIAADSYADCPDCLVSSYGLLSHRDAWSFGKVRNTPGRLFPPVPNTNKKYPDIYHIASLAKARLGHDETNGSFTDQKHKPSKQPERPASHDEDSKTIDSCLVCTRPKSLDQDLISRGGYNPAGKIPPPTTPVTDIPDNDINTDTTPTLFTKPVPRLKRDKPKMKPKLLLNVHLPRVPQSIRNSEENDFDFSEDKIRKHVLPPKHHLETR